MKNTDNSTGACSAGQQGNKNAEKEMTSSGVQHKQNKTGTETEQPRRGYYSKLYILTHDTFAKKAWSEELQSMMKLVATLYIVKTFIHCFSNRRNVFSQ